MVYNLFHVEQSWVEFLCKYIIGFRGLVLGCKICENRPGNLIFETGYKVKKTGWDFERGYDV